MANSNDTSLEPFFKALENLQYVPEDSGTEQTRLSDVLFNTKKFRVLSFLLANPDQQVSLADIISATDTSRPFVSDFIDALRDIGLVRKQKKGNLYLITINTDSAYYEPLTEILTIDTKPLFEAVEWTTDQLSDQILEDAIVTIGVFGSVARGVPSLNSDIDVLIVYEHEDADKLKKALRNHFEKHGETFKVDFSLSFYSIDAFREDYQRHVAFAETLYDETTVISGTPLADLLEESA